MVCERFFEKFDCCHSYYYLKSIYDSDFGKNNFPNPIILMIVVKKESIRQHIFLRPELRNANGIIKKERSSSFLLVIKKQQGFIKTPNQYTQLVIENSHY